MRTRKLEGLHWALLVCFIVAGLSGGLLYLRALSAGLLGPYVLWLRTFHVGAGLAIVALWALSFPDLPAYLQRRWLRVANVAWIGAATAGWLVTGVIVMARGRVPDGWRAEALSLHDAGTIAVLAWAAAHTAAHLLGWQWRWWQQAAPAAGTVMTRRHLVRYSGALVLGCLVGGGWRWLTGGNAVPRTEAALGGERGYFRIYRVSEYTPPFDPAAWTLAIEGLVDRPQRLRWADVQALPPRTLIRDFHCVSGWMVGNVRWTGVPFAVVAARAGVRPEARFVSFYSADGVYSDSFTIEQALDPDVLFAYQLEGQFLVPAQGAPLRVINPRMYGYKGVKWVNRVVFTARRQPGYWERLGYDVDGYVA